MSQGKRNREKVMDRRRAKKAEAGRIVKEKFAEENKPKPILAKNENQKKYLHSLQHNTISVGKGSAGVGKSFLAASVAANKYLKGEVKEIIVTRPYVTMGKTTGFWPGSLEDKLYPFLAPILTTIKNHLGHGKFNSEFGKTIKIQPMEALRGMSFPEGTYLICDESQNLTVEEVRSICTRLEEGAFAAFCGDDFQRDIPGVSGIVYLCDIIKKFDIEGCGVVEFTSDDIVRSGLTKQFVQIFESEGSASNIK